MSYGNIAEYRIVPAGTFKITRGCAGCKGKQTFSCTNHFRVNANGNRLDVWLIYGCETCGHTYNLPVYERVNPGKIPKQEYHKFLSNDKDKVLEIGTNKAIFVKHKAEIAWDLFRYEIVPLTGKILDFKKDKIKIYLYNPYHIPIRIEKATANILQISRGEAKRLIENGQVAVSLLSRETIFSLQRQERNV